MKRSQALEEIRKVLQMNGKADDCGELEEAILHHIETIGMQPPCTLVNNGGYSYYRFGWESENEA
jgi:hypothetical protein